MANNLAQASQRDLLDMALKTANSAVWTAPASIWVGLCTAAPSDTAAGELTAGSLGYNRIQITFGAASTASPAVSTGPTATGTFVSASGNWSTIVGYALFAASTGSTGASRYIAYGSVSPNVTVTTNDIVEFAAGAISLSFD